LATRREVLEHLSSVPSISAGHLDVTPLFGHGYTTHQVREGRIELRTEPVTNGQVTQPVRVRARRLLKPVARASRPCRRSLSPRRACAALP
jgi:hypothetical protein